VTTFPAHRPAVPPVQPGEIVQIRYTKFDGAPHWSLDGPFLGVDAFGAWVGAPLGTAWTRPGHSADADVASVVLFPAAGWTATFHAAHPTGVRLYCDLASQPRWERVDDVWRVTMVDLDLDVVTLADGTIWIDDEDEFAEHQVRYGYPADLVAQVEADSVDLLRRAGVGERPFDGMRRPYAHQHPATADRWLELLDRVTAG
jgi:protein associated with RNAse G/E